MKPETLHSLRTNPKYTEFHFISYPIAENIQFNSRGRSHGDVGARIIAKYILDNNKFAVYLCYGTIEHPNTDYHFITLTPEPIFGEKAYEDIPIKITKEFMSQPIRAFPAKESYKGYLIDLSKNKPIKFN